METASHRKIALPLVITALVLLAIGIVVSRHRTFPSCCGNDLPLDALYFILVLSSPEHGEYPTDISLDMDLLMANPSAQKALIDLQSHEECGQVLVRTPLRTTVDAVVNLDDTYDVLLVVYKHSADDKTSRWGLMVDNFLRTREIYSDPRSDSMTFIPVELPVSSKADN